MTETGTRQVMVRPWQTVEGIPPQTLREVFGDLPIDGRIEHLVLIFEFWLRGGAVPDKIRREMIPLLSHSLTSLNAYRLVSLLAKRGVADEFFDLASPAIDRDGAFRQVLLAKGITADVIRHYADWHGVDPRRFLNGFLAGMAESAASVVTDLVTLGKLIIRAWEWQIRGMVRLATDPAAAIDDFWSQVTLIGKVFDALVAQLDPRRLPASLVTTWRTWNAEFERHLETLDAFAAGHVLGRIGGDLWQMLTGIEALVALLRVAGRMALQYASLLAGRVRSVAAESAAVLADLVSVLRTLGTGLLNELPRIGLATLATLVPPRVIHQIFEEGRGFLNYLDLSLLPIFDEGYALAAGGARMRPLFAMVITDRGKPIALAMAPERIVEAASDLQAQAMASIDETLAKLDALFDPLIVTAPANTSSTFSATVAAARALQDIEQRLPTHLKRLLEDVTRTAFDDLRKSGRRFTAAQLGTLIHTRMKQHVAGLVQGKSPGLAVYTEQSIRTMHADLAGRAARGELKATLSLRDADALNEPIAAFLARRPDLLKILGVPDTAAARTVEALGATLNRRFHWQPHTTIGDLRCDLVLVEPRAGRAINVDWTSSTRSDRFASTWTRIVDDLKDAFRGDPNQVPAAYRRAFGEVPAEVQESLRRLRQHADRETVIRRAILEELLGGLWPVSSYEMFYTPLNQLRDAVSKIST
jgi:hypothetical protein